MAAVVLLGAALPLGAVAQLQPPRPEAKLVVPGKEKAPEPRSALLLRMDTDCTVRIDGGAPLTLKAGEAKVVKVLFGERLIAAAAGDGTVQWEQDIAVADAQQGILRIEIQPLQEAHERELAGAREVEERPHAAEQATRAAGERRQALRVAVGKVFRDKLQDGTLGPEMVVMADGTFEMGSPGSQGDDDEHPRHPVTFGEPFALGKTEVTFDDYDRFARATGRALPEDDGWGRGNRPVIHVSWEDAVAYTAWLSSQTGAQYRLPSEAEWEYGARAGTQTTYWWGDDALAACAHANLGDQSVERLRSNWSQTASCDDGYAATAPVGSFSANPFGLCDTAGNVWEWVADCYHASYAGAPSDGTAWVGGDCARRVVRGGSWVGKPVYLRSASRTRVTPDFRHNLIGFRLARTL
jgi:formylglycine-generating enzyme required for sulfatase activity